MKGGLYIQKANTFIISTILSLILLFTHCVQAETQENDEYLNSAVNFVVSPVSPLYETYDSAIENIYTLTEAVDEAVLLSENPDCLLLEYGIDLSVYQSLSEPLRTKMLKSLYNRRQYCYLQDFALYFSEIIVDCVFLNNINNAQSESELGAVICENANKFVIDLSKYNSLTEWSQENVLRSLRSQQYTNLSVLKYDFADFTDIALAKEKGVLCEINTASSPDELDAVICENAMIIGVDMEEYQCLTEVSK